MKISSIHIIVTERERRFNIKQKKYLRREWMTVFKKNYGKRGDTN